MPKTALEHLDALLQGNAAFARASEARERARLALGQAPYAVVLGCSDSRVPVETIFHRGPGEIFVVRVAGNIVDDGTLASVEYAVAVLATPLVLVLGHTDCGAVGAAIRLQRGKGEPPAGHIGHIVERVLPAVRVAAAGGDVDLGVRAVEQNVRNSVAQLADRSPVLQTAVAERRIAIRGAVYDLAAGDVRLIDALAPDGT